MDSAEQLLREIINSDTCNGCQPPGAKPLLSFSSESRILIVGQAPGIKAMEVGTPWKDASGNRLREWMGIPEDTFYNNKQVAIVPMDFCFPGKGKSGDLPPRPFCAQRWMARILAELKNVELSLLIGAYAQAYFLGERSEKNLTTTIQNWKAYSPEYIVMPHPSPRNNIWLMKNEWFQTDLLPILKDRVDAIINNR